MERKAERKGDTAYMGKNYETKTYTASSELLDMILESVGEEIEELLLDKDARLWLDIS